MRVDSTVSNTSRETGASGPVSRFCSVGLVEIVRFSTMTGLGLLGKVCLSNHKRAYVPQNDKEVKSHGYSKCRQWGQCRPAGRHDQLVATINAIKDNPSLAYFKFRATNEWVNGGHSRTRVQSFTVAGQEDASRSKPFVLEGDEPPVLLGSNAGPNAVEAVLHALASCLAVGFIYNAAAQGIQVDALEFTLEGEIDLHGFLGLSDKVRPGYQNIRVSYRVKSNAPREKIEALCDYVQKTSHVLDIIRNPVLVTVTLADDTIAA